MLLSAVLHPLCSRAVLAATLSARWERAGHIADRDPARGFPSLFMACCPRSLPSGSLFYTFKHYLSCIMAVVKRKMDFAPAAVKETSKRQKQLEPAAGQALRHAAQRQPLSQAEMAAERDFPEHARAVKVEGVSAAEPTSAEQAAWDIPEACVVSDVVVQVCSSCLAHAVA